MKKSEGPTASPDERSQATRCIVPQALGAPALSAKRHRQKPAVHKITSRITPSRYHAHMHDTPASFAPLVPPESPASSGQRLRVQLYTSPAHACSYLPNQEARLQLLAPQNTVDTAIYAQLIEHGFRRSGLTVYRPHCKRCASCVPLRVPTATFTPTRSQRRAMQQHQALQVRLLPLAFQADHYALYQRYQQQRHGNGSAPPISEEEYHDFILASPVDSFLAEFRDATGALKIVALSDCLPQALSAVYTFYAPEAGASYGSYAILWQLAQARRWGLPHLHLGYWVAGSAKMQYKARFRPCEVLLDGHWQPISAIDQQALL